MYKTVQSRVQERLGCFVADCGRLNVAVSFLHTGMFLRALCMFFLAAGWIGDGLLDTRLSQNLFLKQTLLEGSGSRKALSCLPARVPRVGPARSKRSEVTSESD